MFRIGHGIDVHALQIGRKLILAGVNIEYEKGLLGHSDADVVSHAIIDAILGAIAKGDIGHWFPDTDPQYKGADSMVLLKEVWQEALNLGYSLGNLDITILAQKPKLAPYIDEMKNNLITVFQAKLDQINIKATTTEKLGFTGREEGIMATAIILLTNT